MFNDSTHPKVGLMPPWSTILYTYSSAYVQMAVSSQHNNQRRLSDSHIIKKSKIIQLTSKSMKARYKRDELVWIKSRAMSKSITMFEVLRDQILEKSKDLKES